MVESYPAFIDDSQIGNTPSGIYPAGILRTRVEGDAGDHAFSDRALDPEEAVVFPLVRPVQIEAAHLIQSFRLLLESVVHLHDVANVGALEDPWVAEIAIPETDIQIGIRLRTDETKDYWEVWLRSANGSLQAGANQQVSLQFLSLSLSARADVFPEFLPMQLSIIAHEYGERKITQAYVKAIDGKIIPGTTSTQAMAAMQMTHQYILRALSVGQKLQKVVGF